MSEIPTTSPFATDHTNSEDVAALIAAGLDAMKPNGDIEWSELDTPIGYSRGWLIVRRAYLEVNEPSALVTLPTHSDPTTQSTRQTNFVRRMRDEGQISWGEMAVRLGMPESRVRKIYRGEGATKKDLGLRIGKGGRFAYDDPTLYLENRKAEGAWIPVDKKGRPLPTELLNFQREEDEMSASDASWAKKVAAAKGRITKMQRKADDPAVTPEEREAFLQGIADLKAKYKIA